MSNFLAAGNTIYAAGSNANDKLGIGSKSSGLNPFYKQCVFEDEGQYSATIDGNFISISTSLKFSMALDDNGNVWGCGFSDDGEIGISSVSQEYFLKIPVETKFKDLSCGQKFTVALDFEGNIWITGSNEPLNLNYDTFVNGSKKFVKIHEDIQFESISASSSKIFAIDSDGYLYICGNETSGVFTKLIDDVRFKIICSSHLGGNNFAALDVYGNLWAEGSMVSDKIFRQITSETEYKAVSISLKHLALIDMNDVVTIISGDNTFGQLGSDSSTRKINNTNILDGKDFLISTVKSERNIIQIATTYVSTLLLDAEGNVSITGTSMFGELGFVPDKQRLFGFKTFHLDTEFPVNCLINQQRLAPNRFFRTKGSRMR